MCFKPRKKFVPLCFPNLGAPIHSRIRFHCSFSISLFSIRRSPEVLIMAGGEGMSIVEQRTQRERQQSLRSWFLVRWSWSWPGNRWRQPRTPPHGRFRPCPCSHTFPWRFQSRRWTARGAVCCLPRLSRHTWTRRALAVHCRSPACGRCRYLTLLSLQRISSTR